MGPFDQGEADAVVVTNNPRAYNPGMQVKKWYSDGASPSPFGRYVPPAGGDDKPEIDDGIAQAMPDWMKAFGSGSGLGQMQQGYMQVPQFNGFSPSGQLLQGLEGQRMMYLRSLMQNFGGFGGRLGRY